MITRIEIDGFKSFLDFELDVPPFLALVGPNASGKSNLFDALEYERETFLIHPQDDGPLLTARRGRPHELFHRVAKGRPVREFTIRVHRREARGSAESTSYSGAHIDDERLVGDGPNLVFATAGHGIEKISAREASAFMGSVREPMELPEEESHTLERQWESAAPYFSVVLNTRFYVPDPQAMRRLVSSADLGPLRRDGGNLAAVLGRMRDTEAFDDLLVDLASLVPDIVRVVPELDEKRQEWSFDLIVDGQGTVPSSLLSDGTLRVLGLLAALHDPDHSGSIMIEEIENGLHPSRLAELLRRIRQRVTDLDDPASLERPLRQVILTSHSPVVVAELYRMRPDSLAFMDTAVRVDPDHDRVSRVTIAKPVREGGEPGTYVSPRQVREYLSAVRPDPS